MGKVVYNGNAVSRADNFQPAVRAEKTLQGFGGDKFVNAEQRAGGDGGQSVGDVKPSMSLRRKVLPSNLYSVPSGSGLIWSAEKSALRPSIENVRLVLSGLRISAQASQSALTTITAAGAPCEVGKKLAEFFNRFVVEGNVVDKRDIWVIFFN